MTLRVEDGVVRLALKDWEHLLENDALPAEAASVTGVPESVAAAREPVVQLRLDVANSERLSRHHAWIDYDAVALLVEVAAEEYQLMAMPPSFLAGALARLTRLGPRKVAPPQARRADAGALDDLLHTDPARRAPVFQDLGLGLAWILAARAGENELRLAVAEDVEGGLLFIEPDDEAADWAFSPTGSTAVWRRFTSLLSEAAPTPLE